MVKEEGSARDDGQERTCRSDPFGLPHHSDPSVRSRRGPYHTGWQYHQGQGSINRSYLNSYNMIHFYPP